MCSNSSLEGASNARCWWASCIASIRASRRSSSRRSSIPSGRLHLQGSDISTIFAFARHTDVRADLIFRALRTVRRPRRGVPTTAAQGIHRASSTSMSNPGTTPGAPAGGPALPAKGAFPQHLVAFFARKFRGALVRVFLWRISAAPTTSAALDAICEPSHAFWPPKPKTRLCRHLGILPSSHRLRSADCCLRSAETVLVVVSSSFLDLGRGTPCLSPGMP